MKSSAGTQIWPLYKKDSKGSQTISIITNLGLPRGKASCEVSAGDINYSIASIPLRKDGKAILPKIPDNCYLERIDDSNGKYTIENGEIKQVGKSAITLKDTVTTFVIREFGKSIL